MMSLLQPVEPYLMLIGETVGEQKVHWFNLLKEGPYAPLLFCAMSISQKFENTPLLLSDVPPMATHT